MAELNTAEGGSKKKHGGKKRSKKMSTKVDLTPMVDLAFLLITFFMLTTTLNKPNAMELSMPKKEKDQKEKLQIDKGRLLTLILDKDDVVWYYEGDIKALEDPTALKKSEFANEKGIRDIIYDKQNRLQTEYGNKDTMICIIKTIDDAVYGNVVDALDEMDITDVSRFAYQEPAPQEKEAVLRKRNEK
jgi:biopolymer transport protein ExbD